MEWSSSGERALNKLLSNIPHVSVPGWTREKIEEEARRRLVEAAEEKAKERDSELVEEVDLVEGIKKQTPLNKRKQVIKYLKKSGIDVTKYFKKYDLYQL